MADLATELKPRLLQIIQKIDHLQGDVDAMKAVQADHSQRLARIELGQARLDGRIEDAPSARDFGRLEGPVDALEARQPVTPAYQVPEQRRGTGGD